MPEIINSFDTAQGRFDTVKYSNDTEHVYSVDEAGKKAHIDEAKMLQAFPYEGPPPPLPPEYEAYRQRYSTPENVAKGITPLPYEQWQQEEAAGSAQPVTVAPESVATKIPVLDANETTSDIVGQTPEPETAAAQTAPAETAPVIEPIVEPTIEAAALPTPEELPVAPVESESANSSLEKQVSELAELIKALSSQMDELLEQNKQILDRLDRLEGKEPEETPEEKAKREAQERQETHFSMLGTDSEGEEAPDELPEEEKKSRWQRVKDRVRYYVAGGKQENNPDGDPDAEPDPEKKKSKKRALILGAVALGGLVAAGYLMRNGIPWPFGGGGGGGGKEALQGVDLSGIDPNTIHAENPGQFQQGVLDLLEKQGIHPHGVTPERLQQMNEYMSAHDIASGMKDTGHGLTQNVVDFPSGNSSFPNVEASANQGFVIGDSGTGREGLQDWVRKAEEIGITFTRGTS